MIVLNANPDVSGDVNAIYSKLSTEHPDVKYTTNAIKESEALDAFEKSNKIITNSYHFAYWSLLSGGDVQTIAYSSKSSSVLELFGLDRDRIGRYQKGDEVGLLAALRRALRSPDWTALSDSEAARARCRDLNLAFAQDAAQAVPSLKIELRPDPHEPRS